MFTECHYTLTHQDGTHAVYDVTSRNVDTIIINGQIAMKDGTPVICPSLPASERWYQQQGIDIHKGWNIRP